MARPARYTNVDDLEAKCEEYFDKCDNNTISIWDKDGKEIKKSDPIPYTVPGLALHLGFTSRTSIFNYKANKKLMNTIKKALGRIESQRVARALQGKQNPVFSIFDLKNNFGYKDKVEQEISGPNKGPIMLAAVPPTPDSIALWEQQVIESRKKLQIEK